MERDNRTIEGQWKGIVRIIHNGKDWRTMENGDKGIMGSKGQRIWNNGGRREL